jgi:hypothetical protein
MAFTGQPSDSQFSTLVYGDNPQYGAVYRFASFNRAKPFNFASITSTQVTSNVLTVTATNTFTVGQQVEFFSMTGVTALNGVLLTIATATGSQFTANFTHANYGATAETGYCLSAIYDTVLSVLSQEDPSVSGAYSTTAVAGTMAIPTASDLYIPAGNIGGVWPDGGVVGGSFDGNHEGAGRIYGTSSVQTVAVTSNVLTITPQSGNRYSPWIIGTTVTFESFTTATFLNRATVTATAVASNVVTVTCANNFQTGQLVRMQGLTTSTFLNWVTLTVLSTGLSTSQFEANFTHANYSTTSDTGFAAPVATITSSSYSGGGASPFTATLGTVSNLGSTTDTTGIVIGGTFQSNTGAIISAAINNNSGGQDMLCGLVIDTGLQGHTGTIAGLFFTQQGDQSGYADNMACIYMQDQLQTARSRVTNVWAIYEQGATNKNNLGTVYVNGHLGSNAANADVGGTVTVTNPATSQTVNFTNAFNSAPVVTLTPTSDPSVAGIVSYWVTTATGSFTVHVNTTPGTSITFNYTVVGNPN